MTRRSIVQDQQQYDDEEDQFYNNSEPGDQIITDPADSLQLSDIQLEQRPPADPGLSPTDPPPGNVDAPQQVIPPDGPPPPALNIPSNDGFRPPPPSMSVSQPRQDLPPQAPPNPIPGQGTLRPATPQQATVNNPRFVTRSVTRQAVQQNVLSPANLSSNNTPRPGLLQSMTQAARNMANISGRSNSQE